MTTQTNGATKTSEGGYPPATPPTVPAVPPDPLPPVVAVRSAAAGRRTSRRGVIISVLVVLVGGLLGVAGGQMLTRHTQVLAVAADVPVGAVITDADLTVASVTTDPNLAPIPAAQRSQIVGMTAQVGLVRGELLTRAQLTTGSGFTAGQQLVALPLKQGQFPARGLTAGQRVLIVATPGTNEPATGTAAAGGPARQPSQGVQATVADVGAMNPATQVTVLDVQVAADAGVAVAQLASTGNLALILLPAGR